MSIWDDVLTDRDKEVYDKAGYGTKEGFGDRPAVLIVDANYNFVGDKPEPILESIKKFHNSCGEEGWAGIKNIRKLLDAARKKKVPIFYSTDEPFYGEANRGRWASKNSRLIEELGERSVLGNRIVEEIAPRKEDIVIHKMKPSAFFQSPLLSYLIQLNIDSLIIGGTTTSGCVRATVIDAFSYNYKVAVVEDCTFDRGQASHKINLFDMNAKYADVVRIDEAIKYLSDISNKLFVSS